MANNNLFIHSYNFVSYDSQKKPDRIEAKAGPSGLSGYLECSLFTRTPLSIPDSERKTKESNGHLSYPFYRINDVPVIPGSEIRGLVRNIYEIITDSCFSVINSNMLSSRSITKRSADRKQGILFFDNESGQWKLLKADRKTAYTESKKTILLNKCQNGDYVERDWALSVQLTTNMQKLKTQVDIAIKNAKNYADFTQLLSKCKDIIRIIEIENENGETKKHFIFEKKLYGRDKKEVNLLQKKLNSVNAEKKWGAQYSEDSLNEFFALKGDEKAEAAKRLYSEPIINFSLFIPDKSEEPLTLTDEAVERLNSILDFSELYAEGSEETLARINAVRPQKYKHTPVFYYETKNTSNPVVLIPSHFSREVYGNTVESILGERKKCSEKDKLCPGCRLFGMIGENNAAVSSRVRFSDAAAKPEYEIDSDFTTLKVLASPKTTGWEFYADRPYDNEGVALNGRKMYFHNPEASDNPAVYTHNKKEKFNASVQLLKNGEFGFRVYFDNVTEDELKLLVLSLTLGENTEESRLMQKIGHGKPLGLGSVKITVSDIVAREYKHDGDSAGYRITHKTDILKAFENGNPLRNPADLPAGEKTYKDLLAVCDFDYCRGYTVSYPIIEPSDTTPKKSDNLIASHRYFAWMRNALAYDKTEWQTICNKLPQLGESADAVRMPVLVHYKNNENKDKYKTKEDFIKLNNGSTGTKTNGGGKKSKFDATKFVANDEYPAIVNEYDADKFYTSVSVEGQKASVRTDYLPKNVKVGQTVPIIYKGMNDAGYPVFHVKK